MILSSLSLLISAGFSPAFAQSNLKSAWVVTNDLYGNKEHISMTLSKSGETLRGELQGDDLEGTWKGNVVHFAAKDPTNNSSYTYDGKVTADVITGKVVLKNTGAMDGAHPFSAKLIVEPPSGPPRKVKFSPTSYHNQFSADIAHALVIRPGDNIETKTVDSGGIDEKGERKALYGNPQTGPFFVYGARQGDTLAIHIKKLSLNRDYADSLDAMARRILDSRMAVKAKELGKNVRWKIDTMRGVAYPEDKSGGLANFLVPLRPMLGCVAVAPAFGFAPFSTGDCGRFGGNMDTNELVQGSTLYLQVEQPGALIYMGDAHAAQGDGETSEWGLETSMDVEFSVEIIPKRVIATPRIETASHVIAVGMAGSLDEALKSATSGLTQWLEQDYDVSMSEIAQIYGSSVEYKVAQIVGRNVGMIARISKERLKGLKPRKKG